MKKTILLINIVIITISCGGDEKKSLEDIIANGDLKELRDKRDEIITQQGVYTKQLQQLDHKISELDTNKKMPLITSFVVQETEFNHYLEFQGNVTTKNLLVLYPEYAGILTTIFVKEGDKVTKGQILAKIDDGGLNQQLSQLEIQTDLAKTTFERQERLWKEKIGSEMQYLQAKANYEAQEKAVQQIKEQIEKTTVRAPFSGIIDDIITEQGSLVNPGTSPLMRVINLSEMYIETDVPERYLTTVTQNKKVSVEFPVLDKTIHTKIRETSNYINLENRTFKVKIELFNQDNIIKPNLTAKLKINDYTNDKALLIPQSIISENAKGEQYIYIIEKKKGNVGIAKQVIIETGKIQGDVIEVLNGIKNETEVIKEGARSVNDGQEVKILT